MLRDKPRTFISTVAGISATALLLAEPAYARSVTCKSREVVVESSSNMDATHACQGALNATKFLVSQGLSVPTHIIILLVPKMPDGVPDSTVGAFSKAEQRVFVLTYSALKKRSNPFTLPLDRSLYRAIVSHEVAHAIAFQNSKAQSSILAQEYIAYVTLFSTMAPMQREQILRRYSYDPAWQLYAAILYLSDQLEFGAHAYWHFLRPENGQRFFRRALEGDVLTLEN